MARIPWRRGLCIRALVACCCVLAGSACSEPEPPDPARAVAPPDEPPVSDVSDVSWAAHVGEPPSLAQTPPSAASGAKPRTVLASILADQAYDSDATVSARHLVYRVAFVVPPALRGRKPPLLPPAGELHVDVDMERLRARFVGPGWPLEEGTEVRVRADAPGAYLFDGAGGRPLAPGQLASWFQGNEAGHAKTYVYIRREPGLHDSGPGELMCALLSEWSAQPRDELLPRCQGGAMPPGFRIGLWTAELTAIVPMTMPRRKLRADAGNPPEALSAATGRAMLDPGDVARLDPLRMRGPYARAEPAPDSDVGEVTVDNRTDARVVIVAQAVPIAWFAAHSRGTVQGLRPGHYRVGAVRPFGQPAMAPTLLRAPGALRFGKAEPRVATPVRAASAQ
jgi:hypothetical protein